MVRPLTPIIEYQLNYDYITTILCENVDRPYLECNGKCYLIDRISETSKQSQEQNTMPTIDIDDYPVSPIINFSMHFKTSSFFVQHNYIGLNDLSDMYTSFVLRPPIYC